jgi:membrane protein required for colicin V production
MDILTRLTPLDWGLLTLLLLSMTLGAWRGLVFELMSLAGWVVAWWMAHQFGPALGRSLPLGDASRAVHEGLGFVLCFVGALVVCGLLARLVRMLISFTPLTIIDRLLGAVFGFLRGLLLLMLLALIVHWTPLAQASWWRSSAVAAWLDASRQSLLQWLPQDIKWPQGH